MYDGRLFERFKRCRLVDPQRPVWPITDLEAVATQIAEFEILANSHSPASIVDRVDRVCERLIMETHDVCPPETSTHRGIRKLIAQVQRHPGKVVNFDALASQNGMSIATFRRRWTEACKLPPARFLRQVRMREACRLLAETSRLIGEIAREIGFEDELYFSRCFHQETKMAPRDYRKTYQIGVPSK
jgi:transcriptional regulator GlxA family with amidase domain